MNLSSNKNKIVRTADGVPLKEGMTLYVPCAHGRIKKFKCKHWHNGINTLRYYPIGNYAKRENNYVVDMRGRGGAGVYNAHDRHHYECYDFIYAREVFASEEEARRNIKNFATKVYREYKKIADSVDEIEIEDL